jgi:hypothetical protein
MTSRGFTIAIVFVAVALAIGMGRAPCSAAPAVSHAKHRYRGARRNPPRRIGVGFFSIPCLFPCI